MAQQRLTMPNYVPLSHHDGHSYAILFFRLRIFEGKYPVGCWFSEQYVSHRWEFTSQFSGWKLIHGSWQWNIFIQSSGMLSSTLDVLLQALDSLRKPALQPQSLLGEMLSCLYIVADSCDGETPLAPPALWCLHCKAPWFQRRACSACTG